MHKGGFLLILWLVSLAAAANDATLRLQLSWSHQFEFAGFYAAAKNGYFRDVGLEVEIRPWDGQYSLEALEQGKIDIAIVGNPVLQRLAEGQKLQLLGATFQHSPLVFLTREPILNLRSDLRGKRVMGADTFELQALLQRAGLSEQDILRIPHDRTIQSFIDGKVDLFTAFATNQPFALREKNIPFWVLDPKSYGIDGYQDLWVIRRQDAQARPQVFARFRQAAIRGWQYALAHPDEIIDYIHDELGSPKSRAQLRNEMEASLPLIDSGEHPLGTVDPQRLRALFSQMVSLGMITRAQWAALDWERLIFSERITQLTPAELQWIEDHPVVHLANDIYWPPFEFIDAQGQYRGMVAELLQLVSQRTGLQFQPVLKQSWQEVVAGVKEGRLDMFSAAVATPERKKFALFTQPFFSFPMVMLAREGHAVITDIKTLKNEDIGVIAGYSTDELLSRMPLQSRLHRYTNLEQAMDALIAGEISVLVDNLVSLNYLLYQKGISGFAVVGQLGEPFDLAMGVRKDLPLLYSIISKTLDNIDEAEKRAIYQRWLQLKMIRATDHSLLLKVVAISGLVVLVLFALIGWQRRLSKQMNQQLERVQELTFATETDPDGIIRQCTASFAKLLGSTPEQLQGQLHPLFEHTKQTGHLQQALQKGESWEEEIELKSPSRTLYLCFQANPQRVRGKLRSVHITCSNQTSEKLLEQASLQDSLTGLSNRRHFNQIFAREVLRARRNGQIFYWAMLDLDHFKNLNDELGHQKGDEALVRVAELFRAHFHRAGDGIFRLGGEEFGLLIQLNEEAQLKPKLEALRQAVEDLAIPNPVEPGGVLTISIGAVIVPAEVSASPERIYQLADEQLYHAKAAGRNKVMIRRLAADQPPQPASAGS